MHDDVQRSIKYKHQKYASKAANLATDAVHAAGFRIGLGAPLYPAASYALGKYTNEHSLADFASSVFQKANFAVVADGASGSELSKWVGEFFGDLPSQRAGELASLTTKSVYKGGEQRISHSHGNAITIAFPGASLESPKPELTVLAALLGGPTSVKWTQSSSLLAKSTASFGVDVSTKHHSYTDAGLFTITISGSASAVRDAASHPAKVLKAIADGTVNKEDVGKAIAKTRFEILDQSLLREPSIVRAGTGLLHNGQPWDATDAAKGLDSVTSEKIKSVCNPRRYLSLLACYTNDTTGGKGSVGVEGISRMRW